MDEIDIWRTANILIESHGEAAAMAAAERADQAEKRRDHEAADVWRRVLLAIHQVDQQRPSASQSLN